MYYISAKCRLYLQIDKEKYTKKDQHLFRVMHGVVESYTAAHRSKSICDIEVMM